jgi:NAD(P)-dependent dehydrogenase (short-subunit alcohol dehydrogenase family)
VYVGLTSHCSSSRTYYVPVVVTGPSAGGLGAELLVTLAKAKSSPAHFVLAGRDEAKISPVIEKIREANSKVKTTFVKVDFLDNASVRKAAKEIDAAVDGKIDVLINNAGIAAKKEFVLSKDGVEQHFAANFLGHFILTNVLAATIIKSKGIVLNIASMAYTLAETNTEDPNFNVREGS